MDFFENLGSTLKDYYLAYSNFIHSMLPNEAGDFVVILIDAIVVIALVKFIADSAFKRD